MKKETLNNSEKEKKLAKILEYFNTDYLIELLIYYGCVENTINKIKSDFAPEGAIYNAIKDIV